MVRYGLFAGAALVVAVAVTPFVVPNEVQMPGTQPGEGPNMGAASQCDNCHAGYDPAVEPASNWRGSAMAHAGRDPLFWASLAVTERAFAGAGDLCLRCHAPAGWLLGHSEPTNGSALTSSDADGVECALCHKLVNPDDSEWLGVQNAPFLAQSGAPTEGHYGSGQYVLWAERDRLGPYGNATARHRWLPSLFHRQSELCGTCHDVSNPVVGDLAAGNGAMLPLDPGSYSGVLGGALTDKAAFQNAPFKFGMVERTYSEHVASGWPGLTIAAYGTLPPELQQGAVAAARDAALLGGPNGNYADGAVRSFTCQTCHMPPVQGKGASQSNAPMRTDLPLHDMTGGSQWLYDAIQWLDGQGRLRLGGGLSGDEITAMAAGAERAERQLELAAALEVHDDHLRVVNLTGHKLPSGYPEGRRMWLRVRWRDAQGSLLRADGDYGPLQATLHGAPLGIETLLDPDDPHTRVYEALPGISQEWAATLLGAGVPGDLPLAFDRVTGQVTDTVGSLSGAPAGTVVKTLHIALNDRMVRDSRIPPWQFDRDEAERRSALPVPPEQYGDPNPGDSYRHWDELSLQPPAGARRAEVELLYQSTSWEYVQFLAQANPGTDPFLGQVGDDLADAWRNTGMCPPATMAEARWCDLPGTGEDLLLRTRVDGGPLVADCARRVAAGSTLTFALESPGGAFAADLGALIVQLHAIGLPPVPPAAWPGVQLSRIDLQLLHTALPPGGVEYDLSIPPGFDDVALTAQLLVLSTTANNGLYATSRALEVALDS